LVLKHPQTPPQFGTERRLRVSGKYGHLIGVEPAQKRGAKAGRFTGQPRPAQNVKEPDRDKFAVVFIHLITPIIDCQLFPGRWSAGGFKPCKPFISGRLNAGALLGEEMPPKFNMGGKHRDTSLNTVSSPVNLGGLNPFLGERSRVSGFSTQLAFCIASVKANAPEFKLLEAVSTSGSVGSPSI
jgi:hypothetical protein